MEWDAIQDQYQIEESLEIDVLAPEVGVNAALE